MDMRYIKLFIDGGVCPNNGIITVDEIRAFKAGDSTDYALGKPATAASFYAPSSNTASRVTDGNTGSYSTAYATANDTGLSNLGDTQWVLVDLGSVMSIDMISVATYYGTGYGCLTDYRIAVSTDGNTFNTIRAVKGKSSANATRVDMHSLLPPKSALSQLTLGDMIQVEYTVTTQGALGTFANLGAAIKNPIAESSTNYTPDGTINLLIAGFTPQGDIKLIPDINIQQLSWQDLNDAGAVTGVEISLGNVKATLRLLAGGLTAGELDDEWDNIIVNGPLGGAALWQADNWSWVSNTYGASEPNYRTLKSMTGTSYASSTNSYGFRPVIILKATKNILQSYKTTPRHVYLPQHTTLQINAEVVDGMTKAAAAFQLQVDDKIISPLDAATVRTVSVADLPEGSVDIQVWSLGEGDVLEMSGIITVKREVKHRSIVERTFLATEGSYAQTKNCIQRQSYIGVADETTNNPVMTNIGSLGIGSLYKMTINKNVTKVGVKR